MKKGMLLFLLFVILIFMGCESNRFELETTINPKTTLIGGRMAVEYKLGDLLILDEWKNLNIAELLFLSKDKESKDKGPKEISLKIIASDGIDSSYFYYNYGNIEIKTNPVDWSTLYRNADSFPNVKWLVLNDKTIQKGESNKKIKKEKEEKKEVNSTNNRL